MAWKKRPPRKAAATKAGETQEGGASLAPTKRRMQDGGVKPPLRGQSSSRGKYGLETWRVLGDYVEGAFEGEAGAAEGAFFEEAAD